jgi:predicted phage tail protein
MLFFPQPIPVVTPLGEGMAIYATNAGTFANDVWTVALNDRRIRHFRVDQITMENNATWNLTIEHESNT